MRVKPPHRDGREDKAPSPISTALMGQIWGLPQGQSATERVKWDIKASFWGYLHTFIIRDTPAFVKSVLGNLHKFLFTFAKILQNVKKM
jgi:hypothetical protein